jgi:NDP-sugar pyrophosphorylase family protein
MHNDLENDQITTALLLAAGSGRRLRPLTNDQPKCLTEIDDVPILERLVDGLCDQGFTRLVVVVGYLEHRIREFLGERCGSLAIDYVVNPRYATTNNIYSLWQAREIVQEPFVLIESDLLFEASLLRDLQQPNRLGVSLLQPWMDGSTVTIDPLDRVQEFQLGTESDRDAVLYKTVNICRLSLRSWLQVIRRMEQRIAAGDVNSFYERVFADMVADGSLDLEAVVFDPDSWHEIDTLEDLQKVELFFRSEGREQAAPA